MFNLNKKIQKNIIQIGLKTPGHPYRILINAGSGSGKANKLLNLINDEPDIDQIYSYAKDPYEAKSQLQLTEVKVQA